jgi:hypothetical protein
MIDSFGFLTVVVVNGVAGAVVGSAVADDGAVVRGGLLILWRKAEHANRILHLGEGLQFY